MLAQNDEVQEKPIEEPRVASPRSRHILVVDDSRDAADGLLMLLRLDGHDVRVAYDGASALDLAAQRRLEVVLLDMGLPDLGGCEGARRLRALLPARWGRLHFLLCRSGA